MIAKNQLLESLYQAEHESRKRCFNELQEMKGKVRVFCRIRPLLPEEQDQAVAIERKDEYTTEVLRKQTSVDGSPRRERKLAHFDAVFGPSAQQKEVFKEVQELVQSAVDGYSVTILTYGQTGAGKTYTMYGGDGKHRGIAPRTIEAVFEKLGGLDTTRCQPIVRASLLELYKSEFCDLLACASPRARLGSERASRPDVQRDSSTGDTFVTNAEVREVAGPKELLGLLQEGFNNRHVATTMLNAESSRSHVFLTISVDLHDREKNTHVCGKIRLCDLAGAERPKKSGASGEVMKEAIEINKALTALGDVIESASRSKGPVPYRNHKLTQLLSDSLGGTAKTLMFVNVSPACSEVEETLNSLAYASRARSVSNEVRTPRAVIAG